MFNYYLRKKKLCEREGELVNNMARINAELATIIFVTSSKNGSKISPQSQLASQMNSLKAILSEFLFLNKQTRPNLVASCCSTIGSELHGGLDGKRGKCSHTT